MAELHSLPRVVRDVVPRHPEPAELTPTRHSLRQAIARCYCARREAEAAAAVVGRLNHIVDEHSRLQSELLALHVRDERERGEWIVGGRVGLDPGDPADTHALNNKIAGMADELAPARRILPAKEEAHRDALTKLQGAQTERTNAVAAVAVELSQDLAAELTATVNRALTALRAGARLPGR